MRSNVTRRGFFATVLAALAWRPWRGTPTVWVNGGEWPPPTGSVYLINPKYFWWKRVDDNWRREVTKAFDVTGDNA